jgi:hypothetical protein
VPEASLAAASSPGADRVVEMPLVHARLAVEAMSHTYTCELCGGSFVSDRPDEAAQAEALRLWGRRGDAGDMGIVCEECFLAVMAWLRGRRLLIHGVVPS